MNEVSNVTQTVSSRRAKLWSEMTDAQFNREVLKPVIAEAKRRNFTIKVDPFNLLGEHPPGYQGFADGRRLR